MSKVIAYACSSRPNALWSAAQFDNALPKNRTECDIPLVAKADYDKLETAMQDAIDLLLERRYGNSARSPSHNARVCLQFALTGSVVSRSMSDNRAREAMRHPHWRVSVETSGDHIVSIEPEMLAGREPSAADIDAIRTAAHHLLAFIGDPTPTTHPAE